MNRVEFQPGEVVKVQVPKNSEELQKEEFIFLPFGGNGLIVPVPKSGTYWKDVPGVIVEPEVKPANLKERILFSRLLDGPHVIVKVGEKQASVPKKLVRK